MLTETELPHWLQYLLVGLQILGVIVFIYLVWPHIKAESWKAKFIDNKQAFSIIIVLIMIFSFLYGLGAFFDTFFPVERLDMKPIDSSL